jgi:hypothetical protein
MSSFKLILFCTTSFFVTTSVLVHLVGEANNKYFGGKRSSLFCDSIIGRDQSFITLTLGVWNSGKGAWPGAGVAGDVDVVVTDGLFSRL